jgi:hypothetical protein
MNARHKLNQSSVNGALLLAGFIGACSESWAVFLILTAVFVALSVHAGEIRMSPSGRRPPGRRSRRD